MKADPRPQARLTGAELAVIVTLLGVFALTDVLWLRDGVGVVSLVMIGGPVTFLWGAQYRAFRRSLSHLRSIYRTDRDAALLRAPSVSAALELRKALEEDPPREDGTVACFVFPAEAERRVELLAWLVGLVVLALASAIALTDIPAPARLALALCTAAGIAVVIALRSTNAAPQDHA